MAGRLDLLDRLEAGRLDLRPEPAVRGGHLGIGGDDVAAFAGKRLGDRDLAPGQDARRWRAAPRRRGRGAGRRSPRRSRATVG